LTLHLTDGPLITMRWLPEYNDDLSTIRLLRSALGDRLSSFDPTKR